MKLRWHRFTSGGYVWTGYKRGLSICATVDGRSWVVHWGPNSREEGSAPTELGAKRKAGAVVRRVARATG